MGKKGKKSKRNAALKDADKVIIKSNKLLKVASKLHEDYLLSDAANQYREVIELLESKKELKNYSRAYFLLFTLEYYRRNYNAAIDCLRSMKSDASCTEVVSLYHQLIMLRTYLEQYRLEFKRLQRINKDCQNNFCRDLHNFITSMMVEHPPIENRSSEYAFVFAQWYYIIHAVYCDEKEEIQIIDMASEMIESYLECASKLVPFQRCFTCDQAVKYVCSGCRIARYYSIDHQRMTLKKEAVQGMRIGHEILCPLYKAYRKFTIARKFGEEEKKLRMQRRFRRECRKFLEYGLGLKNKCFPREYQSLFFQPS